ncbi:MAG: 50S ribosomal protein L10 [Candidatus Pacebacteria bacterium]|nr:50S ribosomal protein L10 [Candidatus Paceibacterota bacterium]
MPKTKEQKQEIIKDLQDKVTKQKASVFVDFGASTAKKVFQFRDELKEAGCLMQVVKKSLLEKALQQVRGKSIEATKENAILEKIKEMKGQMAVIFGFTDEVAPAKISYLASKKNDQLKLLAGILGKEFLEQDRVMELAKLPSKPELVGKLLGSMQAPISNFVYVLNGNIKGLVTVLSKIKQ